MEDAESALFGYLARHGSWHLAAVGRHATTVDFLVRLEGHEARERLLTVERWSAALAEGLSVLRSGTDDEHARVDGRSLVRLLLGSQERTVLRPGCRLLAKRSWAELGEAFAESPNPSATAPIILAEELARRVVARDDRRTWSEFSRIALSGYDALLAHPFDWNPNSPPNEESDHPAGQIALHAFRFATYARPDWVTVEDSAAVRRGNFKARWKMLLIP